KKNQERSHALRLFCLQSGLRLNMEAPLLVTGGAGFIGSNFVLHWLATERSPVVNLDKLTYAGNLRNLESVENDPGYTFVRADVADRDAVRDVFAQVEARVAVGIVFAGVAPRLVLHFPVKTIVHGFFPELDISTPPKVKGISN